MINKQKLEEKINEMANRYMDLQEEAEKKSDYVEFKYFQGKQEGCDDILNILDDFDE